MKLNLVHQPVFQYCVDISPWSVDVHVGLIFLANYLFNLSCPLTHIISQPGGHQLAYFT